jgi:hypothetical protein
VLLQVVALVSVVQQRGAVGRQLVLPLAVLARSLEYEALAMQLAAAVVVVVAVDCPDIALAVCATVCAE